MSPTPATDAFLCKGMLLAVEQAGWLLSDAAALYRLGSYSTGLAIAQFGREELGRSRILQDLRTALASGQQVTVDDIRMASEDHVGKQGRSQVGGIALRPTATEGLGRAIIAKLGADPRTEDYQRASDTIDLGAKHKAAHLPGTRHRDRLEALYVDPTPDGQGWNRPRDLSRERCRVAIEDFFNDYANGQQRASKEGSAFPELIAALPLAAVGLVDF